MIVEHTKLILTTLFFIPIGMTVIEASNYNTCKCCNNQLQQDISQQTTFIPSNQEIEYQHNKHGKNNNKNRLQNNKLIFIREQGECRMFNQFDLDKLNSNNMSEETINGSWQLNNNCITDKSINMEDSIFEIINGIRFETQCNSMSCITLDYSTFIINNGGKYVHQSTGFNTLDNETKVILYPNSSIIWNSPNYRLFDATGDTSFIAYPGSVIDSGSFGNKNTTHYIIDGNNKTSTIYLNRIKYDMNNKFTPNSNIQGILYDMNVVLPTNDNNNKYEVILDESTRLAQCKLYPNLYFKNCVILNEDFTKTVDIKTITDWIIKGINNTKAILSKRDVILSDQTSNNNYKFSEYDIELGYTSKNNTSDERAKFHSLFNEESESEYNISNIVIDEKSYPCYFDLSSLPDCFNIEDETLEVLNNIPNILKVGLIGNDNITLVNCNINEESEDYKEVKLFGNNSEYYGVIFASSKTENITFGEKSYARIDVLFDNNTQLTNNKNTRTKKRYIIGEQQSQKRSRKESLSSIGVSLNENKIKCNVTFDGSNKVLVEGQSIIDLNITKNAKYIKLIPYENTKTVFNIGGVLNLEEYISDKDNETGIFVIDEGVEVKA